ncbi:MAG: hypothetical protein JW902_19360 [Syntrophaceae bacterium]|nr:hypothetical protein [Syntrophaceae bacterium]
MIFGGRLITKTKAEYKLVALKLLATNQILHEMEEIYKFRELCQAR